MTTTYTLINSTTLSSTASSVTFNSIPQTYSDLELRVNAKNNSSGQNYNNFYIQFNSDTTTLYSSTWVRGFYGSPDTGRASSSAYINYRDLAKGVQYSDTAIFGLLNIYIPNYTSGNLKSTNGWGNPETSGSGDVTYFSLGNVAGLYRSTNAITSITLSIEGGNLLESNSYFSLYGIKNS